MEIEIIENGSKFEFKEELASFLNKHNVQDIKFAVTPNIHTSSFGSYSNGEIYYAMVMYED